MTRIIDPSNIPSSSGYNFGKPNWTTLINSGKWNSNMSSKCSAWNTSPYQKIKSNNNSQEPINKDNFTPCLIGVKTGHYIEVIKSLNEGKLNKTGKILLNYYKDIKNIDKLINNGTIKKVTEYLEDIEKVNKTFDIQNYCTIKEVIDFASKSKISIIYIYDVDFGQWFVNATTISLTDYSFYNFYNAVSITLDDSDSTRFVLLKDLLNY